MVLDKEAASVACNHPCRFYILWDPTFLNRSGHFAKVTVLPSWGGFSFSFLAPAHKSFYSHQWVVGRQFHGWPPLLPELECRVAFNPGHVEHTSLSNRWDVLLGVMDQQPSPCKSFLYAQETKNSKSKWRRLIPAHRLCDKDPSNLKAVLITNI